jgi:hypothetical protein
MSSLKSYFTKKHLYTTQEQLKNMTVEQIINLNPEDVKSSIINKQANPPLENVKKRALNSLLSIKRVHKTRPDEGTRQQVIKGFLDREGFVKNPEVDEVINTAIREMTDDYKSELKEAIKLKGLGNRLNALSDKPLVAYTEEEKLFMTYNKTGKGKRRTFRKKMRKEKTRKGRKTYGVNTKKKRKN